MSLVELRRPSRSEAVSGGAMDRVVVRKRIDKRILIGGAAGAVLLLILLFWLFAPSADSLTIDRNRLAISTAQPGTFEDFLPVRARVTSTIASTSRMCWRNLFPSPSPREAPRTRPAMSTNSIVVDHDGKAEAGLHATSVA